MTGTDREDLYQQAIYEFHNHHLSDWQAIRAVVDLALDAKSDRQPWEVLREAAAIFTAHDRNVAANDCKHLAKGLEAEHHAAQEKAAADAEREKLIEQATAVINQPNTWDAPTFALGADWAARALADAGLLSAPTTDGGAA